MFFSLLQGFQNKPAAGGVPPVTLSFTASYFWIDSAEHNFKLTNPLFQAKFSKNGLFTLKFATLNMIYFSIDLVFLLLKK